MEKDGNIQKSNLGKLRRYLAILRNNPRLIKYAITHPGPASLKDHYEQSLISKQERCGQLGSTGAGMPFHNDSYLQDLIKASIDHFEVSTFFETGTFKADSLLYLINVFKDRLKYVSCEINADFYKQVIQRVSRDPIAGKMLNTSVTLFNLSSPEAIRKYSSAGRDELTLWWLDAHWYSYWPLLDELKEVLRFSSKALIFIDDFKVPVQNYPVPAYSSYGGKDNDFEYIDAVMNFRKNFTNFDILLPTYHGSKALKDYIPSYVAIYMNLSHEFDEFLSKEKDLMQHFTEWSPVMS